MRSSFIFSLAKLAKSSTVFRGALAVKPYRLFCTGGQVPPVGSRPAPTDGAKAHHDDARKLFVQGIPTSWTVEKTLQHFDAKKDLLEDIILIKSREQEPTGKAIFVFKKENTSEDIVKNFSGKIIPTSEFPLSFRPYENRRREAIKANQERRAADIATGVPQPNVVHISNISFNSTKTDLNKLASDAGSVEAVHMPQLENSDRHRGWAIVTFKDEAAAKKFIESNNGKDFNGRALKVNTYVKVDRPRRTGMYGDRDRERQPRRYQFDEFRSSSHQSRGDGRRDFGGRGGDREEFGGRGQRRDDFGGRGGNRGGDDE